MMIFDKTDMLIETKFSSPLCGQPLMCRKRLLEQLDQYKNYRLLLITAPAGYGKTALISSWVRRERKHKRAVWLTVDEEDNKPEQFWRYFMWAYYRNAWIPQEMRQRAEGMLHDPAVSCRQQLVAFLNDASCLNRQTVILLDGFEAINDGTILKDLKFLIKHLPSNMHLLLSGRKRFEMELAKLTVSGGVLILDQNELRFSEEETAFFLPFLQTKIPWEKFSDAYPILEGWAAGIRMAVLPDGNRLLFSYLEEEVAAGLRAELIVFMVQTSLLNRFSSGLCDFLFNRTDSHEMINEIKARNLFVTDTEEEEQEQWFRYHELFRRFLKNRLCKEEKAGQSSLYRKAARWHEASGRYQEAVDYAVKGEDFETAVRLIEIISKKVGCRGQAGLLHKWNLLLPQKVVDNNPRLLLNSAWAYSGEGKIPDMLQCIKRLRELEPISAEMRTELTALSSTNLTGPGEKMEEVGRQCEQALAGLSGSTFLAQLICFNLGVILLFQGLIEKSLTYFEECYTNSVKTGGTYLAVTSNKAMCMSMIRQGKLLEAEQESLGLLEAMEDSKQDILPVSGLLYAQLAEIYYQRNELEKALAMAQQGARIGELGEDMWPAEENYLVLEKVYQAVNDRKSYQRIREKAVSGMEGRQFFDVSLKMESYHAQILVMEGKLTLASRKITDLEKAVMPKLMLVYPELILLKSRFYLCKGKPEKSEKLLLPLKSAAMESMQSGLLCEVLVLLSVVYEKMEKSLYVLRELDDAVGLAEEQGRIRIFLDEKDVMKVMLNKLLHKRRRERTDTTFVELLLDCFRTQSGSDSSQAGEMLSIREIEILRFVKQGADNADIGEKLFISPNTVKTHLLHIYTKLGVHSRLKAVSKAQALHII